MYKWLNNINTRHSRDHSIFIRTFSTLHKVNTIESRIRKRDKFFTRRTNTPLYFIIIINHFLFHSTKSNSRVFWKHKPTETSKNLYLSIAKFFQMDSKHDRTKRRKKEEKEQEQSISISTPSVKYPPHIIDFPTATLSPLFEGMGRWGRDKMAGSVGNS